MTDANIGTSAPFGCAGDPTAGLIEMFVGLVQEGRIKRGQRPAERPVFRKLHGAAHHARRSDPGHLRGRAADPRLGRAIRHR